MNIRTVTEPRRWAAFHCFGIYEVLLEVQASVEDLTGALDAGQLAVAKYAGRTIVLHTAGIRSLLAGGFPPDKPDPLADPFAGLSESETETALRLASDLAAAEDIASARIAADRIFDHVRELETSLGFDQKPGSVRRPEGLFPALRLARELLPVNRGAHLPLALPGTWLPAEPAQDGASHS
ncbi:hypothetical protein [Fodinicola acaciae]|uniref:hypothetical protein n=1 Tax=Fodinicola acaciae TaxID=2681555 RepID=UPI0013D43CAC|nr:hypothetical protein [Fodinicola acaciae]